MNALDLARRQFGITTIPKQARMMWKPSVVAI